MKVVVALIEREGKLLMGTRRESDPRIGGYWEFPGGKVQAEETETEALKREIKEELGCEVLSANFYRSIQWQYPHKDVQLQFYWTRLSTHELIEFHKNAHHELRWMSPQEALQEKLLPANISLLEEIQWPSH